MELRMSGLLKLLGGAWLVTQIFGVAAGSVQDKIVYGFKGVRKDQINLFGSSIIMQMMLTNNNPVTFVVQYFDGELIFGSIRTRIKLDRAFELPPGQQVVASFTAAIDNSEFLMQLADTIESGALPTLRIDGNMTGGLRNGKVVSVPVIQDIQIL
jgi:hypothetical protein